MNFWQRWKVHAVTSAVLAILVLIMLRPFADDALFRTLDHLGGDAVVRAYQGGAGPLAPVVVIDLGPDPTIDVLAATLRQIAENAHPRAVGLDFIVSDLPNAADGTPDPRMAALRDALHDLSVPVGLPVVHRGVANLLRGLPHIRDIGVELTPDEDGVVRETRDRICAYRADGQVTVPTLAGFVADDAGSETMDGCEESDPRPILFAPVRAPPFTNDAVSIAPREMLAEYAPSMREAYVILGDLGSGSRSDFFLTPQGLRPGVVIHAEAAWTLASGEGTFWRFVRTHAHGLVADMLEVFVGILAGCAFAAVAAFRGPRREVDGPLAAIMGLAWGLAGLFVCWLVLMIIGVVWTWIAVGVMRTGLVLGAATAIFGAMLDTLIHIGYGSRTTAE
jgi:hypothetical protein